MEAGSLPTEQVAANTHHGLAPHEVVLLLGSDPDRGLSAGVASERLQSFGPNVLPGAPRESVVVRALRQFHNPLIYVLAAAGLVTALLGQYVDSAVIVGVMVVNAIVGFVQESKAEVALDALRSMVRTTARVVREGREETVSSEDLVPGDLILVEAGDKVPADARLLRLAELQVDESALTGESSPAVKDEVLALPGSTPVADRRNMLYSGTLVTSGTGQAITVATGSATELGEINRLVGSARVPPTPLTVQLAGFSRALTVAILGLAVVTYGIGLARGEDAVQTFTAAVALAVGAIPEGLPAAVTITLAIGVGRMARRRAVIRRLPAVETLGSTTVVCSDKTGTLTENQMTVREVWTADAGFSVSGDGYAPYGSVEARAGQDVTAETSEALRWCLMAGGLCNDAALAQDGDEWSVLGDPTEGAMLVVLRKAGPDVVSATARYQRVDTVPFSSERGYMATLHLSPDTGEHIAVVKGGVERVIDLCAEQIASDGTTGPVDHDAVHLRPRAEPHDRLVVAGGAPSPRLPAVVHLAARAERRRVVHRRGRGDQVLLGREQLVVRVHDASAQRAGRHVGQVGERVAHQGPPRRRRRPRGCASRSTRRPASQVSWTTPVSSRPAYGVTGCRECSRPGSTVNDSSGASTQKSASAPSSIRPLCRSAARSAHRSCR